MKGDCRPNPVIAMCKQHRAAAPIFEERSGFLIVTFKAGLVPGKPTPQVTPQVLAALTAARTEAKTREELQEASGIKDREHFRKTYLEPMLESGWSERTIPEKPRSRMQKYRLTPAGEDTLKNSSGEDTK
jgi:hypothetical protein